MNDDCCPSAPPLVLCLLLAPPRGPLFTPTPPIETLHIGSHDGTEIQKDTYYLVRGETVTTQGANADNYNIYYKEGTLTLRAAALRITFLYPERPPSTWWEKTPLARKTPPPTWASKASPPEPSPSLAQAPAPFTAAQKASSRYSPTAPQTPK